MYVYKTFCNFQSDDLYVFVEQNNERMSSIHSELEYFINLIEHEMNKTMRNALVKVLKDNKIINNQQFNNQLKYNNKMINTNKIIHEIKRRINLNHLQIQFIIYLIKQSQLINFIVKI